FMRDPNTWFPRLGRSTYGVLQPADMDLTFHIPSRYRLASIGRLVESRTDDALGLGAAHRRGIVQCGGIRRVGDSRSTDPPGHAAGEHRGPSRAPGGGF